MRGWTWALAALAIAGCKQGDSSLTANRSGNNDAVKTEQKKAEDSLKQAEDSQKKASKEQDQAKRAETDVEKARRELAEKEQKAQKEQSEAQQAQANAAQQGQSAQQTATAAQQRASQEQAAQQQQSAQAQAQQAQSQQAQADTRAQAAAPAGTTATVGSEQQISGKLAQASDQEVRIENAPQPLKIDSSTQITLDGQPATASQLQPGNDVRASFRQDGTATRIDVKSK